MARIQEERVWAGTESSLKAALEVDEAISARLAAGNGPDDCENEDEEGPRLLEVVDGIATITIKGSLNNDQGFWNEVYGMTGYPEIRDAMLAAAADQSVKEILLDIDSGGGAVSGVSDTANLIRLVNDHVKPVTAFTDGTMASAAYWLGCAAGSVYAGRTAVVGSIGVLSTHKEYSQMYKEAGIGVTVVRAGKYKALANSVEPLSAEGRKQIQQVVDAAYTVFVEHVSAMRGQPYAYTDETMAQGQEFVGEASVKCGLVDGIKTFDDLISEMQSKLIDSSNNFMENRGKPNKPLMGQSGNALPGDQNMARQALTPQDIAAIAAGAAITASVEPVVDADQVADAGGAADPAAVVEPAGVDAVVETTAAAAAQGSVVSAQVDTLTATVQLLKEQVASRDEALLQANVKIARLEEAGASAAATQAPLMAVVAASVANLQVALGGTASDMSAATAEALVAEHARLAEQFNSKFKAGGVAAVSADQASKVKPQVSPRHRAQVAAAGFHKK